MWLKHKLDLFLTVLIFSDFIKTISSLTGENICLEQERYVAAVRKPFKKPVHIREYKWCLQIPPRCEEDKIIYVDDYKTEDEERIRIIEKCCTGYKENPETKSCIPISCSHCVHATCNSTIGKCLCDDGYIGENCDTRCSSGKWGPECSLSCDCNYSTCQHTNGTCICVPGWIGQRCDISCPVGYYGENCNQKCSKCVSSCDPITGECTKDKRKALLNIDDIFNNSSVEIPVKQSENNLLNKFLSNNSSSNNDDELIRNTSDVFTNSSTEKPSSTQLQNRRKYFPSTSQDYVPKYIKIIQSYSSKKPINQDFKTNQTNSSIVYIKKPTPMIKKSTTLKINDDTHEQMTTISIIDIIGTTDSYTQTLNDEDNSEPTTEPLPTVYEIISSNSNRNFENEETTIENINRKTNISSRDKNGDTPNFNLSKSTIIFVEPTMEMTTKNFFLNNNKSNIDDTERLNKQQSHSNESSTNSFSVHTTQSTSLQSKKPNDYPPKVGNEYETTIQSTTILPKQRDGNLNTLSSPQIPQTLEDIIIQDAENIDSVEIVSTTRTWLSDIYQTIETSDQIKTEKTFNNPTNPHLLDTFQATETTFKSQPETTSEANQRNSIIVKTYQATEIQPEISIENQSITVIPELTTEILSEILVENLTSLSNLVTSEIPVTENFSGTDILDTNALDTTQLPQTKKIVPKTTNENVGNLDQLDSTDIAKTEMVTPFIFTEPSITATTSDTTPKIYVSDTPTVHENHLELEITTTKKLDALDENVIVSQANVDGKSLNTMQPNVETETNQIQFLFTDNNTNTRSYTFSDFTELGDKRISYEEMTSTTETFDINRDNEPEDILIKADNKTVIPSFEEQKTTPWYRATYMKPEVQIPINNNDSTLLKPTYHSITSDAISNGMKIETDIVTIPNQTISNDGSINNMEMTLNNNSIKLFITNPNLYKSQLSNSSEKEYYPIWAPNDFTNTENLEISNLSNSGKSMATTVDLSEEQKENLRTPNNFNVTVNPNLSIPSKEQKQELWTPINFDATENFNLANLFEGSIEEIWTPITFDTTVIPKLTTVEQQEDSWTPNNIVTSENLSNLFEEEYTPDKLFISNSTELETKYKGKSSPVIQTTTNPTKTEDTIAIPLMNDTHLNRSQQNSTVSDIIKMLTSKTYFNQYQISTKVPLNSSSPNPMQNITSTNTLETSTIKFEPVLHPTNLTLTNQTQTSHDDITTNSAIFLPIFTYPPLNNTYNYIGNHPNQNQTLDKVLNPFKEILLNSQSTTPIVQTKNNLSVIETPFTHEITFNFSEILSTVQPPFSILPTTDNNSYETSTLINENIKLDSEIFISKNISIKIFSTPGPENIEHNKNITKDWQNKKYNINQKNLDDSDIIPILREIFPRSTTQKIETTTKSSGSDEFTTFAYNNQTDVFDYETYEEVSTTNRSIQTTEYSIIEDKSIKYNNLSDVIIKIYNDDDVIKDLERNNDLLRRVHDAIVKDSLNNNQTMLINQSNTQTIYHTVMITLLGIAIGIFLAIIIASIILYMTDTSRKVAKHTQARLQNTVMNKKDYVPNSVHYIQRDEFMTPLQERITIFNPKFTAEPESTFGNLLTTDCRDKVNRFITDTLRVVYDNTYDHPQSPPTNGQFVGSTFFASKSDQSAEHLYDEIPAWKQPKPIAHSQLPQYSETCEYVTKSDGPDIVTTKL